MGCGEWEMIKLDELTEEEYKKIVKEFYSNKFDNLTVKEFRERMERDMEVVK